VKPQMDEQLIDNRVHLLYGITGHGVISTGCGAAMQHGSDRWDNKVNYWGRVGIRKHRPFTTITIDPSKVTCKRKGCKQD
jgi:hypothetical protein